MSSLSEHLGILARTMGQLLSPPTKVLTVMAGFVLAVLALLTAGYVTRETTGPVAAGVVITIWVALALPVVTLARRRRKWLRRTADTPGDHQVVLPPPAEGTELTPVDLTARIEDDMRGQPGQEDVQVLFDAFTEARAPGSPQGTGGRVTRVFSIGRLSPVGRALGSIERAQRALLTAAGGTPGAPYLADDLRLTVASFVGTLLVLPLATLMGIILAVLLLTS